MSQTVASPISLSYTLRRLTFTRLSSTSQSNSFVSSVEATAMQNIRKVAPGQRGAKRLLDQYGTKLICVRYRSDRQRQKRCKTVELIIEEVPWTPPPARIANETLVGVRVAFKEVELQRRVKQAHRQMESCAARIGTALRASRGARAEGLY